MTSSFSTIRAAALPMLMKVVVVGVRLDMTTKSHAAIGDSAKSIGVAL